MKELRKNENIIPIFNQFSEKVECQKKSKKIKKIYKYQRLFTTVFIKSRQSSLKRNIDFLSKKVKKNNYIPVLSFTVKKKKEIRFDFEKIYSNEAIMSNDTKSGNLLELNHLNQIVQSCEMEGSSLIGYPRMMESSSKHESKSIEMAVDINERRRVQKDRILKSEHFLQNKNWQNLKKIFKFYSKEIEDNNFREKLNMTEIEILKNLFDLKNFDIQLNNYEFLIKKGIKNLHKKILHQKYHKQNMNFTKKLFKYINQKIFNNFIDKIGRSLFTKTDFKNFLNYYFGSPNKDLELIVTLAFFEYKKKESFLLFSFQKFKREFFGILFALNKDKWESFQGEMEKCLEIGFDEDGIKKIRYLFSDYILICYNMNYLGTLYNKI